LFESSFSKCFSSITYHHHYLLSFVYTVKKLGPTAEAFVQGPLQKDGTATNKCDNSTQVVPYNGMKNSNVDQTILFSLSCRMMQVTRDYSFFEFLCP